MIHSTTALVAKFKASGLKPKQFCSRHGIAVSTLQYHLHKVRNATKGIDENRAVPVQGRFIPLQLENAEAKPATFLLFRGNVGSTDLAELVRAMCC